jgi:hypothetical protein
VYSLHADKQAVPDWPNIGFDFNPVMQRFNTALAQGYPDMDFVPVLGTGEEDAKKIVEGDKAEKVDGYIVFQMNCWNRVVQGLAATGKPVLYVDFQFGGSGGFLVYTAEFMRKPTPNLGFVASSKVEDLLAAVKCFKMAPANEFAAAVAQVRVKGTPRPGDLTCIADSLKPTSVDDVIARLKASKILLVLDQESGNQESVMGIPVVKIPFAELNDAWAAADKDQVRAIVDRWQNTAAVIEGVESETLHKSAAMYLAKKAVMRKYAANAITVNCLGGFYGGHIHAYPCLGFHELCNEGLVGACEGDVNSTATMVLENVMTGGRPGYISDPVMDSSKRQIIYAHCVAPNRAFGPQGPVNPFQILTHSEDRKGASVRSILPVGYLTTTMELSQARKEILFHQAKIVANDPDDRACRTKIAAEPIGDFDKLFTMWDKWSWHRVTCYGDLKEPVFALADKLGWKVVEEV